MKTYPIATTADRAAFVKAMLASAKPTYQQIEGTNYTVCIAMFEDGWSTLGYSVCVDANDFNKEKGEQIAFDNAITEAETHYWRTSGYMAATGITEVRSNA